MSRDVKRPRRYDSSRRLAAAAQTRHAVLGAARRLFVERGYAATTMSDVAESAQVAIDTVYASVGRKPQLFRALLETAISGTDEVVAAEDREYVRQIKAEPDPARKLELYAAAVSAIAPRLGPLFRVLREAAAGDADLGDLWREIGARRARNMRLLAEELAATGRLRPGVTSVTAADVIWATNAPEFTTLLLDERGWDAMTLQAWLADAWKRLLLVDSDQPPPLPAVRPGIVIASGSSSSVSSASVRSVRSRATSRTVRPDA